MPNPLEFYETAALGLISKSGTAITDFSSNTLVDPSSFYLWVEIGPTSGDLVVVLADDPDGQTITLSLTHNGFYPVRIREVVGAGTEVEKVIPLYPREETLP